MSLEYQPAAHAEEFCKKRVPCPYEKCLRKTAICVIVLQKSHKFSIFKAGPYAQEFSCILRQTTNFCGSIWGCSWDALVLQAIWDWPQCTRSKMAVGEVLRLPHVRRVAKVASSACLFLFALPYMYIHVSLAQDKCCDKFGFIHTPVLTINSTVLRSLWRWCRVVDLISQF